ncbi:MAG: helix-turn-helix domain-containing protein [Acidimicrobiia bacterium]|nr:helix-turn-helix domain-containing protein [Acidimicrobiia bacterium]
MEASELKKLLTPNEVAELLNVSVAQVYTLLRGNELPGLKIGKRGVWRVDPDQLAAYVQNLRTEALDRVRAGGRG